MAPFNVRARPSVGEQKSRDNPYLGAVSQVESRAKGISVDSPNSPHEDAGVVGSPRRQARNVIVEKRECSKFALGLEVGKAARGRSRVFGLAESDREGTDERAVLGRPSGRPRLARSWRYQRSRVACSAVYSSIGPTWLPGPASSAGSCM